MLVARQHPQTDAEIAFGREIAWCPSPLARNARSWLASYFAGLVKENSPCRHKRILLLSDGVITTTHGCCHAVERSHRTTDETARPARPCDRDAGRQHGEGRATAQHLSARCFEIDRGTRA